ncbi:MAG: hypothetical protein WA949_07335 [Phormidesmis sp.]
MNKLAQVAGVSAGVGLLVAGVFSFEYMKLTGWTDKRVDPYTLKAVCRTTTYVSLFGQMHIGEGPELPNSECVEDTNLFLTETPNEGCSVNTELLTVTCKEAYEYPFY